MKQFDMRRFGLVLKLDFAEGWKPLMWNALLMLLIYLFMFWFCYKVSMKIFTNPASPEYIRGVCESVGVTGGITMYFFFIVCASRIFFNVQQKQKLTAYLMLPASNLEKFASRWVYMLAFSIVGGVLTFLVADALHAVWLLLMGRPVHWATAALVRFYGLEFDVHRGLWVFLCYTLTYYALWLLIHAFYLFGGVFFRRYHFVATSALGILLCSVWFSLKNFLGFEVYWVLETVTAGALDVLLLLGGIVLLTWLSYRLFCRYQVVTRKFVSL